MSNREADQPTERVQSPSPQVPGAVQGLCSAGTTSLALCAAFLGYWGFQGQGDWQLIHLIVLIPLFLGAAAFGIVPLIATQSGAEATARRVYLLGLVLLFVALIAALCITYTNPPEREDGSIHISPANRK